jgi:hypothetical protein
VVEILVVANVFLAVTVTAVIALWLTAEYEASHYRCKAAEYYAQLTARKKEPGHPQAASERR